jgi:hypothetical protein
MSQPVTWGSPHAERAGPGKGSGVPPVRHPPLNRLIA